MAGLEFVVVLCLQHNFSPVWWTSLSVTLWRNYGSRNGVQRATELDSYELVNCFVIVRISSLLLLLLLLYSRCWCDATATAPSSFADTAAFIDIFTSPNIFLSYIYICGYLTNAECLCTKKKHVFVWTHFLFFHIYIATIMYLSLLKLKQNLLIFSVWILLFELFIEIIDKKFYETISFGNF